MPLIRRQSRVSDRIPTASMADIAFLLLVFFLTTTVFDEEQGLQVVLPEKGPEAEQQVSPNNLLYFLVQPDGTVRVRRGESTEEASIGAGEVEATMRAAMSANPEVVAVIQTSPQARYESMIDVLDGIKSAGAARFSLQVLER